MKNSGDRLSFMNGMKNIILRYEYLHSLQKPVDSLLYHKRSGTRPYPIVLKITNYYRSMSKN
jgi:hypothetical protein